MNAIDKTVSSDITLGQLLDGLATVPEAPLVFLYEGQPVKAGYHVTEIKAGAFLALDCGANPEAWSEMFVQLWDIDEDCRSHMPAGKFSAIIRKVSDHIRLDPAAKLTFEVSDRNRPMAPHAGGLCGCGRRRAGWRPLLAPTGEGCRAGLSRTPDPSSKL